MSKSKLIKEWIREFQKSGRTIEEEIKNVQGSINNEKLWMFGSDNKADEKMHCRNIDALQEYLKTLQLQLN